MSRRETYKERAAREDARIAAINIQRESLQELFNQTTVMCPRCWDRAMSAGCYRGHVEKRYSVDESYTVQFWCQDCGGEVILHYYPNGLEAI